MLKVRDLQLFHNQPQLINFDVNYGDIFQIRGGPGSGKTKIFKILSGVLRPLHGDVFFDGDSLYNSDFYKLALSRKKLGVIFEDPNILSNLSLRQNIEFILRSRFKEWSGETDEIVEKFQLSRFLEQRKMTMSRDVIKRFNFLKVVLCEGKLLVFDELNLSELSSVNNYFLDYLFDPSDKKSVVFTGDIPKEIYGSITRSFDLSSGNRLELKNAA